MGIVQRNSLMIKTVAFSKKYSETLLHMNHRDEAVRRDLRDESSSEREFCTARLPDDGSLHFNDVIWCLNGISWEDGIGWTKK